jgi:hypothetical protein
MDREPAPWETNASRPFLMIGSVGVIALGEDRFLVTAPGDENTVDGFERAQVLAHKLASAD